MVRQRDAEAIEAAAEIAAEVHATPEAKQAGIIIGARAFRRGANAGERKSHNQVSSLIAEVEELRAKVITAEAMTQWTPEDLHYIGTLNHYGMTAPEIAAMKQIPLDAVRHALRVNRRFRRDVDGT